MNFDLRTIALITGIVNILQLLVISIQYMANKGYSGIGWYALGYASMAFGFLLLALTDHSVILSITIGAMNLLVVSGFMFLYIGCMRFLGKQENRWIVISVFIGFVTTFCFYLFVKDDINARTVIRSVTATIFSLLTAHCLVVHSNKSISVTARITAAAFIAQGCFLLIYSIGVLTVAPVGSFSNLFIPTMWQSAQWVLTLVNSTLWMFGLIIMVNQRLNGELTEAKEQIELIFNTSPDSAVVTRMSDGVIIDVNAAFTNLTGLTRDETVGKSTPDINVWNNIEDRQRLFNELLKNGFVENFEAGFRGKDGTLLFGIMSAKIFMLKEVPHVISVTRDITDRKRVEEALRASDELFRSAIHASPDGFVITDLSGRIRLVSPSILQMGGYKNEDDLRGHFNYEFYLTEDWPECQAYIDQLLKGETPGPKEFRALRADGSFVDVESNGIVIRDTKGHITGLLYVMRDISERKLLDKQRLQLDRQLIHSQKLESLAVMAGGIAHDFNNLFMAIIGNLELALDNPNLDESTKRRINTALSGLERSAELSHKMLLYSGTTVYLPKDTNLREIFFENENAIREAVPQNIELIIDIPDNLPSICGEPQHLLRLVLNLLTNAWESLGDKAGRVSFSMGREDCDEAFLEHSRIDEKPPAGEFVFLKVSDNGCGMDEEILSKLFDPFFSTKFWGRGLGMSEVLGIVKGHGGAILVESQVGKGTCIKTLFPVSSKAIQESGKQAHSFLSADSRDSKITSRKKILVVDDEELVRDMVIQRLEVLGYDTIPAGDGKEGVSIYQQRSSEIDLVLLDFMMPKMNGVQAFNELVSINPDVKAIISTGYSEETVSKMFFTRRPDGIIHKPYKLEDLRAMLLQVFSLNSHDSDF